MKLELDEYAHLDSPIHRWHPTSKITGLVILIFAYAFVQDVRLLLPMLAVTSVLYAASRLPISFLLKRLRYPGLFLLGVVAFLPFLSGETVIWQWEWLTLRSEGLQAMLLIAGRFLAILITTFILVGTTPFLSLIRGLRSLGLPVVLADMTLLAYRYLHDITRSLATMQQAMRLRGFNSASSSHLPFLPNLKKLRRLAFLMGTLFVRSYEQSERVYKAMRLRGYGSQSQLQAPSQAGFSEWGDRWSWTALGMVVLVSVGFFIATWTLP